MKLKSPIWELIMLNAKLAFLLSTCHKFNDSFMTAMTRQFEKSKTVATRHYFSLYITLCEPPDPEYKDQFAVRSTHFEFAGSEDIILAESLQLHNNMMLSWEMKSIYNNLLKQNIYLNMPEIIGVFTIASLIKRYKNAGFKYIFIPVIIEYGRGGRVVHQSGIIIDYTGKFIFYEPYGKYMKYGKSYARAVCDFFRIFDDCKFFDGQPAQYMTYHNYWGVKSHADGIQSIIRDRNNARVAVFEKEYKALVDEINAEFPYNMIEPHYGKDNYDADDQTFKIVDLLHNLDSSFLDESITHDSGGKAPDLNAQKLKNKQNIYYRLLNTALEYYCCYNSKTCVTITLVEMNEFFKLAESGANTSEIRDALSKLYDEFRVEKPNPILMHKLNKLLKAFRNSEEIIDIVTDGKHINEICSELFR